MGKRLTAELTEARRDRIVELTRQGLSARQIAGIVGIHQRNVFAARAARGVSQASNWRRLTDAEKARAADMLADGASATEVARTLGCARDTVTRHFPGSSWTKQQAIEHAVVCRMARRLLDRS